MPPPLPLFARFAQGLACSLLSGGCSVRQKAAALFFEKSKKQNHSNKLKVFKK
jgi:hypothetical protein